MGRGRRVERGHGMWRQGGVRRGTGGLGRLGQEGVLERACKKGVHGAREGRGVRGGSKALITTHPR